MVQEGELALIRNDSTGLSALPQLPVVEAEDTAEAIAEPVWGILLTPPAPPPQPEMRTGSNLGGSFILCGLFILALIVSLRFRNNVKYIVSMFRNLVEVRTRQNVFDDTVRETSLIVLLNILWCASAGIVAYAVFQYLHPGSAPVAGRAVGMLVGMAIAVVYTIFLWIAYSAVGWVFSDKTHSELWVKGFSASQALMAPAFFLTALVGLCNPEIAMESGGVALAVFVLGKLMFIWKGYRIFFNQFSSWVLFLCYLCSLEIVPLILSYRCAILLGKLL